jgi:hypothetical protein
MSEEDFDMDEYGAWDEVSVTFDGEKDCYQLRMIQENGDGIVVLMNKDVYNRLKFELENVSKPESTNN